MSSETELRACRCCNREKGEFSDYGGGDRPDLTTWWTVTCVWCGFTAEAAPTPEEAAAKWNTRATLALPEEREKLVERLRTVSEGYQRAYKGVRLDHQISVAADHGKRALALLPEAIAALSAPIPSVPDEAKLALGYFMRAYEGIAADSFDGIEERYSLLLQEGASRARHVLADDLPRLSDPLPDEEAVERAPRYEAREDCVLDSFGGQHAFRVVPIMGQLDSEAVDLARMVVGALNGPASTPSTEGLREALEKCRDRFRDYEGMHRAKVNGLDRADRATLDKWNAEANAKADSNRDMADFCDAALRASLSSDRHKDALVSALHGLKYHGGRAPEEFIPEIIADLEKTLYN